MGQLFFTGSKVLYEFTDILSRIKPYNMQKKETLILGLKYNVFTCHLKIVKNQENENEIERRATRQNSICVLNIERQTSLNLSDVIRQNKRDLQKTSFTLRTPPPD